MGTVYRQKFTRKLASGETKDYESKVWLCRFYAQGRPWRLSTGEEDQARAQDVCDLWERQAKEGLPFNPPPRRGVQTPPTAVVKALPLREVSLHDAEDPLVALHLITYIRARKQLGMTPESILAEVEQLLSSLNPTPRG